MKTKSIFNSMMPLLLATAQISPAWAQSLDGQALDNMYPYIAPKHCGTSIKAPEGGGDAVYSRNCKYAFVLPPTTGSARLRSFAPSMNIMMCSGYADNLRAIKMYRQIKENNNIQILKLQKTAPNHPDIAPLIAQNATLEDGIKSMTTTYAKIEAATAQIVLDSGMSEAWMAKWREINSQMIDLTKTVFVRAPVAEGYVSFVDVARSESASQLDPQVLKSTIPGFHGPDGRVTPGTIYMQGAVSGQVVLSLAGACGVLLDTNFETPSKAKVDEKRLNAFLPATFTYAVPVLSGVRVEAHINVANAVSAISAQLNTKRQFSTRETVETDLRGSSSQICNVNVTQYELPVIDEAQKIGFENYLKGDICTTLIARLAARMVTKGFIEKVQAAAQGTAPAQDGGLVPEERSARVCVRERDVLGLFPGKEKCRNQAYIAHRWQDGISSRDLTLRDETEYSEALSIELNQPILRWRTSGFDFQ